MRETNNSKRSVVTELYCFLLADVPLASWKDRARSLPSLLRMSQLACFNLYYLSFGYQNSRHSLGPNWANIGWDIPHEALPSDPFSTFNSIQSHSCCTNKHSINTKPKQSKKKKNLRLSLPLLLSSRKSVAPLRQKSITRNDFSMETAVIGARYKIKHIVVQFKEKTGWLVLLAILPVDSLLHTSYYYLSCVV